MSGGFDEYGALEAVLVKHPRDAFVSSERISAQWKSLNFSAPPDLAAAIDEYDRFLDIVRGTGTQTIFLPSDEETTLDSIYTRDAVVAGPDGFVRCRMGKSQRAVEPAVQEDELRRAGYAVAAAIRPPGCLEGGDLIWLDAGTAAVGRGRRTNAEGIAQLEAHFAGRVDVIVVPLPDYPDLHDVLHLMSLVSPVDKDLAVVHSGLLPESFQRELLRRGYAFVDVPDAEFATMGTNVLALAPRECVMVDGNPRTRGLLERAGARVHVYAGVEISLKGGGGPTCLTRPLRRRVGV